ncbi:cysteine protease [Thauera aromatica]|uniref:Peptidase n=1 Tax=Thauera aromatica K172 TaxID=44139 RepID=A0A2R4BQ38_THAAR|nr:cysteine protease [Thauera aromatica]AVR89455.1 peptidase [Thauera aromatica K172]MCK2095273.1 cysteine protease [Thauera aromatica]
MIFHNPAGAPELACDQCGCRWFDRISGACYECGTAVPAEAVAEFERALEAFAASRTAVRQHTAHD